MLDSISNTLTIVNTQWLPGSLSNIAIATKDFIKIYDLAEDTMSPTHNIMLFNGFVSDFTFGPVSQNNKEDTNKASSTLYAASKSGQVYYMPITYNANSFIRRNSKEEKMKIDSDNSYMMVDSLKFDDSFGIEESKT